MWQPHNPGRASCCDLHWQLEYECCVHSCVWGLGRGFAFGLVLVIILAVPLRSLIFSIPVSMILQDWENNCLVKGKKKNLKSELLMFWDSFCQISLRSILVISQLFRDVIIISTFSFIFKEHLYFLSNWLELCSRDPRLGWRDYDSQGVPSPPLGQTPGPFSVPGGRLVVFAPPARPDPSPRLHPCSLWMNFTLHPAWRGSI